MSSIKDDIVSKAVSFPHYTSRFILDKTGTQTISPTTLTKVTWEAVDEATFDFEVDLANNKVTTTKAGTCSFSVSFSTTLLNGAPQFYLYKNTVAEQEFRIERAADAPACVFDDVPVERGDVWEIYIYHSDGSSRNLLHTSQTYARKTQFEGRYIDR
jgi:hypothetical protein